MTALLFFRSAALLERINKTLVLEVKGARVLSSASQRGGGTPTNTTLSRLGSSNPCADAEIQEDTHTELAKTRLSRERVWGTRTEQALEDGSQAAHSQDTHHGTTSWSDVSGQQFLISSRFYSQCALNLFYTVATWNWSERLVTCLQDIKTQKVSGLSRVLFAGSFCPLDQKELYIHMYLVLKL